MGIAAEIERPPLAGVRLGKDFWPEITWGPAEIRTKRERVVPWGLAPERNELLSDPLGRQRAKRKLRY